ADATCRVAPDPLPQRIVLRGARIGVGGKPFAERKDVVAGLDHGKPTIFAADGNGAAFRGNQHIRLGDRIIRMMATPTSSAPMNRSGVLNRQSTTSPAVLSSSGPRQMPQRAPALRENS